MYYKVTLLNQKIDKSSASIVLYQNPNTATGMQCAVVSDNPKMKAHLEKVLSTEAFIMTPGKLSTNEATVGTMSLKPGTTEYYQALPEILGWRGYRAVFVNDIFKSVDDFGEFLVLKSEAIYNNAKGERIVKYVPEQYIAVNQNDGRVVMGGRYLNANIDKEGAEWVLNPNPYESMSQPERANAKSDYEMGFEKYHPGMDEEGYSKRVEEKDDGEYHKVQGDFKPEGKTLSQHFGNISEVESKLTEQSISLPQHLPAKLAPGAILYSPELGVALDTQFWPPTKVSGFESTEWFLFDYPNAEEEDYDDLVDLMGMHPAFIKGLKQGIVSVPDPIENLDGGVLLSLSPAQDQDDNTTIVINTPIEEDFTLEDLNSPGLLNAIATAKSKIDYWRNKTSVRLEDGGLGIDPGLKTEKVPNLRGIHASFRLEPYDYQKAVINAMLVPEQYELYGGPRGYFGHYVNLKYGLGKTAIICAADASMRNSGKFKVGKQVTLITAPSKNIHVWSSEIEKFRGESAVVVDGHKGDRIEQWEKLLDKARSGNLPNFVIVSGSKFRLSDTLGEDGEEKKELALDAKYMKLLSLGGKSQGKRVVGNHIAALVLDETGNYVNPKSSRFTAVSDITESVYYGNGLVWTLNGDLSGNSAVDTISEISFVNMFVKKNYNEISRMYTAADPNRPNSDARVWKRRGELPEFMGKFKNHIYSLDGKTVAGDSYGLKYTEDLETPMGKNWGRVYLDAYEKMELTMELGKGKSTRALGMLSLLINASYGAVHPARLLEYDIGTETILRDVKSLTDASGYVDFLDELKAFWRETTEETVEVGKLPKEKLQIQRRDEAYNRVFSDSSKAILDKVVDSWDNPALDSIAKEIDEYIKSSTTGPVKLGVAGFSKRAIQTLYRRLKNSYNESKVLVMKFDGDTDSAEIGRQQTAHQQESDKHVISLVTSAGLYGLSLAADRSWVFSTWNPAKLGQYGGRFHRKPDQPNLLTVVVPSGASEYVREISNAKKSTQETVRAEVLDLELNEETGEFDGNITGAARLVDKLRHYYPRILAKESKAA